MGYLDEDWNLFGLKMKFELRYEGRNLEDGDLDSEWAQS